MKFAIWIFALFIANHAWSQDSTKEFSKFSIGIDYSPNYSYRTLIFGEDLQIFVEAREVNEHPGYGFNTGLSVDYAITEKLEIELGIQFSRQTTVFSDVPTVNEMFVVIGMAETVNWYNYLEIPFRVHFHLVDKKFFVYTFAGGSINFHLNNGSTSVITYNDGSTQTLNSGSTIQDINPIVFTLIGGGGFGYQFTERLSMRLEPLARHALIPLADAPIKQYNYSIGCQIGVKMKL